VFDLFPHWASWYWVVAAAYAGLGLQVFWPASGTLLRQHRLAVAAAGSFWAAFYALGPTAATQAIHGPRLAFALEFLFLLSWFAFLYRLLRGPYKQSMPETVRRGLYLYWGILATFGVVAAWLDGATALAARALPAILLAASLACLALVTQLHRDSPLEDRRVMLAFVAAGGLAAGTQAVLFGIATLGGASVGDWGVVRIVLMGVAAVLVIHGARLRPQWSLAVFVSPNARAYAPRLLGTLVLLAVFLALAVVLTSAPEQLAQSLAVVAVLGLGVPVFTVLFSEGLGARLRVFISKHFLPFRYDYREEWLRLIDTLAAPVHRRPLPGRHPLVASPGGRAVLVCRALEYTYLAGGHRAGRRSGARVHGGAPMDPRHRRTEP
jgi:hypothetical protein